MIDTQVGTEVVALVQEWVGWLDQEHSSVGQEDAVSPMTLRGGWWYSLPLKALGRGSRG